MANYIFTRVQHNFVWDWTTAGLWYL